MTSAQTATLPPSPRAALFEQGRTWPDFLAPVNARQDTSASNAARSRPPGDLVDA